MNFMRAKTLMDASWEYFLPGDLRHCLNFFGIIVELSSLTKWRLN